MCINEGSAIDVRIAGGASTAPAVGASRLGSRMSSFGLCAVCHAKILC